MPPSLCTCPVLLPMMLLVSLGLAGPMAHGAIPFTRADYNAGGSGRALAAGDVDGDVDLAVANWVEEAVSVLRNQGDGTFAGPERYPIRDAPLAIAMADVDGDGDLDLVIGNFSFPRPVAVAAFSTLAITRSHPGDPRHSRRVISMATASPTWSPPLTRRPQGR